MTDKEKIRAEIERLYNQSLEDENRQADRGLECAANVSYGKSKACKELLSFIDSMQEEPVSEKLEQAIDTYLATYFGGEKEKQDRPFLKKMAIHFANWQKEQMMKEAVYGFLARDVMQCLYLFKEQPNRGSHGYLFGKLICELPKEMFPEIGEEDNPAKAKLIIIKEDEQ